MRKRFVELPGGKLKNAKGRFGGDHHHSLYEDDHDDSTERRTKIRQNRRQAKIDLKRAVAEGSALTD